MSLLTVTYDNRDLIESSSTDNFTLVTKDKMMKDDINISLNAIARSASDITISDNVVTIPEGYYATQTTKEIESENGETTVGQTDVNFIDYDGTICYSYTASEFANLTALPTNPSHNGLTAQGWNWTLADAKAYVAKYGKLQIGQMYATDDGKTRIYIHLEEGRTSPMLGCCPNGTVIVDWGDGSATETLTGTSLTTVKWTSTHNYAIAGDYMITLNVTSGEAALRGNSSSNAQAYLLRYSTGTDGRNVGYQNAIKRVEIGENISIGSSAFQNCHSLANIAIPNSVTSIGTYAFGQCYTLTSIIIPNSVITIEANTFYYCYGLVSIIISDSVTSIGTQAFDHCSKLANIIIPDGIITIENQVFNGCNSLASIIVPDTVTSLGNYAFNDCRSLASITIPNGVTSIGVYAFQNCYSLTSIIIPSGVTSIKDYTFYYCYTLSTITIPNGVTNIGAYAFSGCNSLSSIIIPDNVITIGNNAFQSCYSLASIIIPNDVTNIEANTFISCYSLAKLRFESTTPPTVANSNAWTRIPTDCVISVPTGTLEAYTTATNYPASATYTYIEE